MKILLLSAFMLFGISSVSAQDDKVLNLYSPDGNQHVTFYKKIVNESVNDFHYSVEFKKNKVITDSRAGVNLDNRIWEMALGVRKLKQPACWMDNLDIDSVKYFKQVDNTWYPLYGERSTVHDKYNSATMYLSKKDGSQYRVNIEVRAYDEGVAFRYFFPEHPKAIFHKVVDDLTEYTLPENTIAYSEQWAQSTFENVVIDKITRPVERALTMRLPSGIWTALTDADVDDWCLTKFIASKEKKNTLKSVMYSPVDMVTYFATPWKIIMSADTAGKLIENNDIIQNLNPPCEIADTKWIKPGKIMRAPISTEAGMAAIDFCAAHNMQYMLYDWQWYMPCTSHDGDATKVVDKVDMQKVIAYGKEKGIGVWLYVNQHALMKQMDELFPLLNKWGVVGVKSGFVQYATHRWATWLHDMVRSAAKNNLMMNIHDEFRPSGFSRTYPNLLTQEGICGNEEFPDATHNVTLPFTRMINGAADYTICYYDKRLKNTHAHQLAASLVFYSPLLTLFWYDTPSRYNGEPEIEWFEKLPTVFDDTKVLSGSPGKSIVMVRRKGNDWFAGLMANNDGSDEILDLSFLESGKKYKASIYTDGGDIIKTNTHVKCSYMIVDSSQILKFKLKQRGGASVIFEPVDGKISGIRKYRGQIL